MKYAVEFCNDAGERRTVVVELEPHEIADMDYHFATRGPDGPGGPDGLIARGYALHHAMREAPPGFEPIFEELRRVVLQ